MLGDGSQPIAGDMRCDEEGRGHLKNSFAGGVRAFQMGGWYGGGAFFIKQRERPGHCFCGTVSPFDPHRA